MCSPVHPHAGTEATSELPLPGPAKPGSDSNSENMTHWVKTMAAQMQILYDKKRGSNFHKFFFFFFSLELGIFKICQRVCSFAIFCLSMTYKYVFRIKL